MTNSLGIYGSAPSPQVVDCGEARYARLSLYPADPQGERIGSSYTLPLNGLGNFNFFYTPDGLGFLAGGGYKITYTNAGGTNCYGSGDIVTYSPNSGHTNGVQVRPHNGNLPFRGEHGIVRGVIGEGESFPLKNAVVRAMSTLQQPNPQIQVLARTNANGYFSIYYTNGNTAQFLPVNPSLGYERYRFLITGTHLGCTYSWLSDPFFNLWAPQNSINPSLPSYFTNLAEFVVEVPTLALECGVVEP